MRFRLTCMLVLFLLVLSPQPAHAGGWWTSSDLHNSYVGVGESLDVDIREVFYPTIEEARRATEMQFYAYLVKGFDQELLDRAMTKSDPERWWRPLTQPIKVGTVVLFDRDANLMQGRASLTIPQVPPGRYFLMLCDEGCEEPLGNHIPAPVHVVDGPFAAKSVRRLENSNERMRLALSRVRRELRQSKQGIERAQAGARQATEAIAALNGQRSEEPTRKGPPWVAYAGWFIAGISVAALAGRRQRRRVTRDMGVERIPDDARELTKVM